jgi:hypothetical protein
VEGAKAKMMAGAKNRSQIMIKRILVAGMLVVAAVPTLAVAAPTMRSTTAYTPTAPVAHQGYEPKARITAVAYGTPGNGSPNWHNGGR